MSSNPLFAPSTLPFEAPHFDEVKVSHFRPAFEEGMRQQMIEIEAIAQQESIPTFENTIIAMEKSGALLDRTSQVFFNLSSAHTNEAIQDIQAEIAPKLAAHSDNILLNTALFKRVSQLVETEQTQLDRSSQKLLEDTYKRFVRAGAKLDEEQKNRIREINEELSSLTTAFQRNLLALTKERYVAVHSVEELDGLSEAEIDAAAKAAKERALDAPYALTVSNTTRVPLLTQLHKREIRKKLWETSAFRGLGQNGGIDNRPLASKMTAIRAEKASLLGYDTYAAYALETQMSETPDRVSEMLGDLAKGVLINTKKEAQLIEEKMKEDGLSGPVEAWDWAYYTEKVRADLYQIDDSKIKPYFELNRVLKDGVFFTMNQLFGIEFKERTDLPVYHPDVRVFDVLDKDGSQIGLFYADYFARSSKQGGAWMSSFVDQSELLYKKPVIVNVMNISKPEEGKAALLSFDEVQTMFHEMGHGVHGLLSKVYFPSQSGTNVPTDFVEFPSTFQEDWAMDKKVLKNYAYHYETGEAIPQDLLQKVIDASRFNQGYDTQEYLAAALLDLEWHMVDQNNVPTDLEAFEKEALAKYNLDVNAIPPRYKSQFFAHIFAGGYSAKYYAYIWSEILAADAFAYMQEKGGLTSENGARFREWILSKGGSDKPMHLYTGYRQGEPQVKHLLERRGLQGS